LFAGVTDQTAVQDRWMTPYSSSILMPGVEIDANAYETIAHQMFLIDAPPLLVLLCSLRSEEHTSELQSPYDIVCRLLLEKKTKRHALYVEAGRARSAAGRQGRRQGLTLSSHRDHNRRPFDRRQQQQLSLDLRQGRNEPMT